MKLSTKLNIYASLAAAVAAPAIVIYEKLPGADAATILWYICISLGAWVALAAAIFVVNWVFFGGLVLLGRWIWDSFYRSSIG